MLAEFRNDRGLTQKQMAQKIGVSLSYYQKVESGERSPSYEFIKKFNSTFPDVSVDDIFFTQ